MIHELRRYECVPGKVARVLQRFREDAFPIWNEIGIRPLGFWTTLIGDHDQALHYILAWDNLAQRETKWQLFATDPRWQAAKLRSETEGPLVTRISNTMLRPVLD